MEETQQTENKGYLGATWHLAWPIILENALTTLFSLVDTAMVGSLGAIAISAIALNTSILFLVNGFLVAVSIGATVLVAQSIGAGRPLKAASISRQSFVMSLVYGLSAMTVLLLISGQLPVWMGGKPEVRPFAAAYLARVALGLPLHHAGLVLSAMLRGYGDTRTPLRVNLLANALNIAGNFLLIFPTRTLTVLSLTFSMPGADLGVTGAGIATAITKSLTGVILLVVFVHRRFPLQFKRSHSFRPQKADVASIFRIGIPAALDRASHSIGLLFYVRIIAVLGTVSLAAHQLASASEMITYMPAIGFGTAATTLVGQSIGARRESDAVSFGRVSVIIGTIVMIVMALLLFLFARPLAGLFTPDADVVDMTVRTLRAYVWCLPLFAVSIISSGAMRGAGDTRVPFYYAMAGMWLIRLPLSLAAVFLLKWSLPAVWVAMGLDLAFRGVVLGNRLRRKKWLAVARIEPSASVEGS